MKDHDLRILDSKFNWSLFLRVFFYYYYSTTSQDFFKLVCVLIDINFCGFQRFYFDHLPWSRFYMRVKAFNLFIRHCRASRKHFRCCFFCTTRPDLGPSSTLRNDGKRKGSRALSQN